MGLRGRGRFDGVLGVLLELGGRLRVRRRRLDGVLGVLLELGDRLRGRRRLDGVLGVLLELGIGYGGGGGCQH